MGNTPDLEATATVRIRLRRALALTLIIATSTFVGSQSFAGHLLLTPPVAADVGSGSANGPSRGTGAVGGSKNFSVQDFEASIGGRYGGFDIAVLDSRGIQSNNSGSPIVIVDLMVRNSTDKQLRLPEAFLALESTDNGRQIPINRFEYTEHSTRLVVEPGVIQSATAVVRLPPRYVADPSFYRLMVAEPFRQPLLLSISDSDGLGPAGVETGVELAVDTSDAPGVSVLDLASSYNHRGYRSQVDHQLMILTADVEVQSNATAHDLSKSRWWRAVSGDYEASAAVVEVESVVGSTVRLQVVFEVPSAVEDLSIVTGGGSSGVVHRLDVAAVDTVAP